MNRFIVESMRELFKGNAAKAVLITRVNSPLFEVELGPWHTFELLDINNKTVKFKVVKYEDYLELSDNTQALSKQQIADGWVVCLEVV